MTAPEYNSQLQTAAQHYLLELHSGHSEAAFHNLVELGQDVLPMLISAFERESSSHVRCDLLRVISEFRSLTALGVFEAALLDHRSEVWSAALDGLVTLGSPAAAGLLARVISDTSSHAQSDPEYQAWLREAHQQTIAAYA